MKGDNISDLLSKLSLDSETEDRLTYFLSLLRILSKKAAFINDMNIKKWIYLELRKLNNLFVWGCDECQDMKTFRAL